MSLSKTIIIGLLIGCANASFLSQTAASNDWSAYRTIAPNEIAHIIEQIASDGPGTSPNDQLLLNKINELGSAAVPQLILLLDHQDKEVRLRASLTLGGNKYLTEEHLDVLMDSMSKGNVYLSLAIAKIGTPRAISFLVESLKKEKNDSNKLLYAISFLGEKAVPYLVELIMKTENDDKKLLRAVNSIFEMMGDKASSAVDPLIEIALHDNREVARKWAIYGLGSIGEPARRSASILKELAEQNPQAFEDAVGWALTKMKAPEATDYLMKDLEKHLSINIFVRIAELGKNGISAAPELIQYLNHENWEVRLGAARVLGFIGNEAACQPLIGILDNTNDWRLVCVSVESLGRLQSKESVQALVRISKEHWYPPVRDAAKKAQDVIKGESTYELKYHPDSFPSEFFSYQSIWWEPEVFVDESLAKDIIIPEDALSSSNLVNYSYIAYNNVINPKGHKQVPKVGIKVEGGCLVGSSRGEWGGELMFIDSCGNSTLIIKDNIKGIHRTADGILVVAGVAHFSSNRGLVYKVYRDDAGNWRATKWKALPGAPRSSALCIDHSLYIDCLGGQIVLMPDGTIEMIPRPGVQ